VISGEDGFEHGDHRQSFTSLLNLPDYRFSQVEHVVTLCVCVFSENFRIIQKL